MKQNIQVVFIILCLTVPILVGASIPLCKFLEQNNVLPVGDFIAKNGKVVYKYVECESLSKLLKEWGLRKQSERGEE